MTDLRESLLQSARRAVGKARSVGGVSGCGYSLLVAALRPGWRGQVCVVTPGPELAEHLMLDVQSLVPGLPAFEAPLLEPASPDHLSTWIALLSALHAAPREQAVLVTPLAALLDALPAPEAISTASVVLRPGATLKLEEFFRRLTDAGYERVDE
ncbi:MAG: hypothetical protein IT463_00270, partial [Planctomycetes bacterium]|nr:hypothetical protein [Planctomycetota bacterium]